MALSFKPYFEGGIERLIKKSILPPLDLNDGFVLKLAHVLYVPSLRRNLISVSRLYDDGYECHFSNGKC